MIYKEINVDYKYFENKNGGYTAKKLPSPKIARIKIKDESDLDDLREELREEKPNNINQFINIYNEVFAEPYDYEVEVEEFSSFILANRKKLLGDDLWIKKHWHQLDILLGDFEVGLLEVEEEPIVIEPTMYKDLLKAGVIEPIKDLEYDNWYESLNNLNLPAIKELCKKVNIKVSKKKKGDLIHELITYEEENSGTLDKPLLAKALPLLESKIEKLYQLYIDEINHALSEFDYPSIFKASVWEYAADNEDGVLQDLLHDQLSKFETKEKIVKKIEPQPQEKRITSNTFATSNKQANEEFKPTKPLKIAFNYQDYNGGKTFREFRLDKVENDNSEAHFHGFCYLRNAPREFKASRIQGKLIITDTGEELSISEFYKEYLPANLIDNIFIKSETTEQGKVKTETKGCLVAGVLVVGTLLSVPITIINLLV